MIRRYEMRRHVGLTVGLVGRYCLCARHLDIRKAVSWEVVSDLGMMNGPCEDCAAAAGCVLDTVIAEADEREANEEPKPVPVLPGQRRLFE